jgi:hypothetical protein
MPRADWRQTARLAAVASAGFLILALLWLLPDLIRLVPVRYRHWQVEILASIAVAAYAVARVLATGRMSSASAALGARRVLAGLDWLAGRALERWLAVALFVLCVIVLAGWVPHYLTWPMGRDDDTFAVLAQSWDSGILPYRDIHAYNFPGQTYLFWVLGRTFGWGCPVAVRGCDALGVILAGVMMVGWSRARLGGTLPGLIGYLAVLNDYLELPVGLTGQRDWYTALLVCAGIAVLEARPGRWARLTSAIVAALALSIRPQAALFLPALVSAVMEDSRVTTVGIAGRVRAFVIWCLWVALFVALAFAPVMLAGLFGDFVRSLGMVAYGGPYSKTSRAEAVASFLGEFHSWKTVVAVGVTGLWAVQFRSVVGSMGRTWLLALTAALIYRPIAPVQHFYFILPLLLVSSMGLAMAVSWLLGANRLGRPILALAVVLVSYESMPAPPLMFSLAESWRAVRALAQGKMPGSPPKGVMRFFGAAPGEHSPGWDAYRAMLAHIRATTTPQTLVANGFNRFPYHAVNGPTGRLSPFRAESGICWMCFVDIDLDSEFAQALEAATDSVVVWEPAQIEVDPRLKVERVLAVIRKYYQPAATFGTIEIWTRRR